LAQKSASKKADQQQAREAVRFAARLMKNGIAEQVIQLKLTEMGYSAVQASAIVNELRQVRAQVRRKSGQRNMIIGAVIGLVGMGAVVWLGQSAQGSTAYIVMWAAVLFGAAQVIGGWLQYRNN
jgi:cation transport ATPase